MKKIAAVLLALILPLALSAGCVWSREPPPEPPVPVDDLRRLNLYFLQPLLLSGLLESPWESASEIPPDRLTDFYMIHTYLKEHPSGLEQPLEFPPEVAAETVENIIRVYFDVPADTIRQAGNYDAEKEVYAFTLRADGEEWGKITGARQKGNFLLLAFTCGVGVEDAAKITSQGFLTISLSTPGWQYLSCEILDMR